VGAVFAHYGNAEGKALQDATLATGRFDVTTYGVGLDATYHSATARPISTWPAW